MASEAIVEPNLEQAVPFFRVADIAASVRFYVEGLAFRIGPQWRVGGESSKAPPTVPKAPDKAGALPDPESR